MVDERLKFYKEKTALLKALAHPARLLILDMLRQERMCACQLMAILEKPQPYVSQQIRVLREAKLIACDKSGTYKCYRLKDQSIEQLLNILLEESPSKFFLKKGEEAMRTCVRLENLEEMFKDDAG